MRLPPEVIAIALARDYARRWSAMMSLEPEPTDAIVLVVSELVTNAVSHGSPPYALDLLRKDGFVHGEVSDTSHHEPHLGFGGDCGRYGLRIVDACATRWGVALAETGKSVWFEIAAPLVWSSGRGPVEPDEKKRRR